MEYEFDPNWDRKLNYLLDNKEIETIDDHFMNQPERMWLGDVQVSIFSYPYNYGFYNGHRTMPSMRRLKERRPSIKTIIRLKKMMDKKFKQDEIEHLINI